MTDPDCTELVEHRTIEAMVAAWTDAEAEIREAYEILARADARLTQAFQHDSYSFHLIAQHYYRPGPEAAADVIGKARRVALLRLLEKMGLRSRVSQKRWDSMIAQIRQAPTAELPAITVESIEGLVQGTVASLDTYFLELVDEAYKFLRPERRDHGVGALKTNARAAWGLGEKVILHVGARCWGRCWDVSDYFSGKLCSVDHLFHWLDGKKVESTYSSPLLDAIRAIPRSENAGETEYFAFRLFANGNLHLQMKRPDLVKMFNQAVASRDLASREAYEGEDSNLPAARST